MLDIDKIIQSADVRLVAETIGIPMQDSSTKTMILCPGHIHHTGHRDSNFGSCVLTDYGYYCFAASKGANVVKMVQEQYELDGKIINYFEAAKIVAQICGVTDFESSDSDYQGTPFPLTQAELECIGLSRRIRADKVPLSLQADDGTDSIYLFHRTKDYYEQSKHQFIWNAQNDYSLDAFYRNDKVRCLQVMLENAVQSNSKAKECLQTILTEPFCLINSQITTNYEVLILELQNQIKRTDKIIQLLNTHIAKEAHHVFHN